MRCCLFMKVVRVFATALSFVFLAQEGEKITGTYRGRLGESRLDGTIKGNEIAFSVNVKFESQVLTVVYKGTVDKDSMKGTVRFGDRGTGNWTGRRKTGS